MMGLNGPERGKRHLNGVLATFERRFRTTFERHFLRHYFYVFRGFLSFIITGEDAKNVIALIRLKDISFFWAGALV